MLSTLSNTQKGILSALCGFVSFSIADSCAKWLGMHYGTLDIIFWTYLFSLGFGLIFSPFLGGIKRTLSTKKLFIHISRGISALAIALLVVTALKGISLAAMYTILFLAPFLTTIAAIPIYKESVSFRNWGVIALGFSGVLLAFRPGVADISWDVIYCFAALGFIVILGLLARPLTKDESLHSLSFYPSLCVVVLLAYSVIPNLALPSSSHLPVFLLNGFCVTVGLSGIAYGFRIAPYSVVAPIHYIQMVVALTLGYFIFQDVPDIWMLGGASIIIISGVLLAIDKKN
ncbi:MAG: DMT family transporter [Alphaproteobacteria bacterium]